jgi:L-alanine-DL-glutamate epimerase and related enzymes of enolase superfamily
LSLIRTVCPKSQIIIDANESWDQQFFKNNVKILEQFNILLIEQPFPRGKDHYLKI